MSVLAQRNKKKLTFLTRKLLKNKTNSFQMKTRTEPWQRSLKKEHLKG